jgi:hypothetical protein
MQGVVSAVMDEALDSIDKFLVKGRKKIGHDGFVVHYEWNGKILDELNARFGRH